MNLDELPEPQGELVCEVADFTLTPQERGGRRFIHATGRIRVYEEFGQDVRLRVELISENRETQERRPLWTCAVMLRRHVTALPIECDFFTPATGQYRVLIVIRRDGDLLVQQDGALLRVTPAEEETSA